MTILPVSAKAIRVTFYIIYQNWCQLFTVGRLRNVSSQNVFVSISQHLIVIT